MSTYEYTLNCGQYVLTKDGMPITAVQDTLSFVIDKENGIRHKYGEPAVVETWYLKAVNGFKEAGHPDLAESLVLINGRFPLEEVNKLLNCSGYAEVFYRKLTAGEIQELPLFPESSPAPKTAAGPARNRMS